MFYWFLFYNNKYNLYVFYICSSVKGCRKYCCNSVDIAISQRDFFFTPSVKIIDVPIASTFYWIKTMESILERIQSWSTNKQLFIGKVYEYIRGVKPTGSWCSVIWNPAIPPTMSFILWLAKRNRLLTLDKVAFLNKGSLCPLCSNEDESNAHLFFSCRKSLQVWPHIRDLAPFHRCFTSLQRITDSLIRGRSISGVQEKLRCLTIAITVYCIWLSRTKLIFEDYQLSVIEVISKIKFLMYRQTHLLHLF